MKLERIHIYDVDGKLRRTIEADEDGTHEPFDVAAGETVWPVIMLPTPCPGTYDGHCRVCSGDPDRCPSTMQETP